MFQEMRGTCVSLTGAQTQAAEGQGEEHIFCKRKCHLKKEAHWGDLDSPRTLMVSFIYQGLGQNASGHSRILT